LTAPRPACTALSSGRQTGSRCAAPVAVVVEPDANPLDRPIASAIGEKCRHLRGADQSFAPAGREGEGVSADRFGWCGRAGRSADIRDQC
jgi:hypothetical protein